MQMFNTKVQNQYQHLVDAFLAQGGQVKVYKLGQSCGMTLQDWKDRLSDRGVSPANAVRPSV